MQEHVAAAGAGSISRWYRRLGERGRRRRLRSTPHASGDQRPARTVADAAARRQQPRTSAPSPSTRRSTRSITSSGSASASRPASSSTQRAPRRPDQPGVDHRPHVLQHRERVAAAAGGERAPRLAGDAPAAELAGRPARSRRLVQRSRASAGCRRRSPTSARKASRAAGASSSRAVATTSSGHPPAARELAQHPPGRLVAPLHVVQVNSRPPAARGGLGEQRRDRVGELPLVIARGLLRRRPGRGPGPATAARAQPAVAPGGGPQPVLRPRAARRVHPLDGVQVRIDRGAQRRQRHATVRYARRREAPADPAARAVATSSRTSRLLPLPGGPWTSARPPAARGAPPPGRQRGQRLGRDRPARRRRCRTGCRARAGTCRDRRPRSAPGPRQAFA